MVRSARERIYSTKVQSIHRAIPVDGIARAVHLFWFHFQQRVRARQTTYYSN
jgi:hypothetical protein